MDIQSLHQIFLNSTGVCTDTRNIEKNQLFFALSGDNFDGNKFAFQAIENGAGYSIIDKKEYEISDKYILVNNVLECLQQLATFHQTWLKTPIIAITGTNGKTTTKELIANVLKNKYITSFTKGNLNNHIGVPLTLLSFTKETEIGVVEMGANHLNEISFLCKIALPDFGIINNIGKAHLEGFGSFEGVIKAKSELYNYCRNNNKTIFVNGDDELLLKLSDGITRITYGQSDTNDCFAEFESADPFLRIKWNGYHINTQLVGAYNFNNVLAAIAVGRHFNVEDSKIAEALSEYKPQNNRSQLTKTENNTLIIDAYNANPSSMDLAIRNFGHIKVENKLLVLGDMFELGEASESEHQKIIDLVITLGAKKTYFVGKNFYHLKNTDCKNFQFFLSTDQLVLFLSENKISGYTILLKASRGIKLEKVIEFL